LLPGFASVAATLPARQSPYPGEEGERGRGQQRRYLAPVDDGEQLDDLQRRRRGRREERRRQLRQRRVLAIVLGAVALCLVVIVIVPHGSRHHDTSLVANVKQTRLQRSLATKPAQGRAFENVIGYTRFIRTGSTAKREVALTFDDGPGPYTRHILRILRRNDAPATFFVLGNMVGYRPGVVRKELADGHAVGGHTFDHPRMASLTADAQRTELDALDSALTRNHLPIPQLFRPPYGSFDGDTVQLLEQRHLLMALWSVDTGDYLDPGSDVIAERALDGAAPGAVILMHDAGGNRSETVDALPKILRGLRRRHLEPVTIPELLVDDPPPRNQNLADYGEIETETNAPPVAPPTTAP
jgi:peptidoglycan/xylan/chitin deacetylase (PgdA/CDA1 family)